MGRGRLHIAVTIAALSLAGCGFADSRSPVVPEFMRIKAADPPPLEAPPLITPPSRPVAARTEHSTLPPDPSLH